MGDREAFMRMMGISDADIENPDAKGAGSGGGKQLPQRGKAATTEAPLDDLRVRPSPYRTTSEAMCGAQLPSSNESNLRKTASTGNRMGGGDETGGPRHRSAVLEAFRGGGAQEREQQEAMRDAAFRRAQGDAPRQNIMEIAESCKTDGNGAFERGEFLQAIQHYTRGIESLERGEEAAATLRKGGVSDDAIRYHDGDGRSGGSQTVLLAALYSNRSASYLQASKQMESIEAAYDHSLFDADHAVSLRPDWFKGYSRQGDTYFKMVRYKQAVEAYAMALSLDPQNHRIAESLREAKERAKAGSREEWKNRRSRRAAQRAGGTLSSSPLQQPLHNSSSGSHAATYAPGASSEHAREQWEQLKVSLEATSQSATGDGYRLAQLEKYRTGKSQSQSRRSSPPPVSSSSGGYFGASNNHHHNNSSSGTTASRSAPAATSSASAYRRQLEEEAEAEEERLPPIAKLGGGSEERKSVDIPSSHSTAAASAYQQKLLENYRRKRGQAV